MAEIVNNRGNNSEKTIYNYIYIVVYKARGHE